MADRKLPELGYEGLGDIDLLMHNQGVSDLSWLAVSEEDYRASEALPKQNLDIIPELQTALTYTDDERVPSLIPLRPHTIVNTNPLDRPGSELRVSSEVVRNKVAKYVMAGLSTKDIASRLRQEFAPEDMIAASAEVRPVLDESGLLGNVYVNASHFPRCAQDGSDKKFVASTAKRALFVLAKSNCGGCVHNRGGVCASFQKRIVSSVPYTKQTVAHYSIELGAEHRLDQARFASAITDEDRKQFLKSSFSKSPVASRGEAVQTIQHHPKPSPIRVTEADVQSFWDRRLASASAEEMPGPLYLKAARQLMVGSANIENISSSSNEEVRKLAREYGILGHSYVDMDAMGGCRPTLDLIDSKDLSPDFILRRASCCGMCQGASDGACAVLASHFKMVSSRPEPSKDMFSSALERALFDGRMNQSQVASVLEKVPSGSNWASMTAQANLFQPSVSKETAAYEGPIQNFHHGDPGQESTLATMDPEEVRRTISHMMNTGLQGRALQAAVLSRYSRSDLAQVPEVGGRLASEEGIQGTYFVDPTAYSDYGRGCVAGSQQFRKRGAPYVLASTSCTGCTLQTAPGWCSKYSKSMIRQVPTEVRSAAKERRALQMVKEPVPVVENPVEKYELASEMEVDLNGSKSSSLEISIDNPVLTD